MFPKILLNNPHFFLAPPFIFCYTRTQDSITSPITICIAYFAFTFVVLLFCSFVLLFSFYSYFIFGFDFHFLLY